MELGHFSAAYLDGRILSRSGAGQEDIVSLVSLVEVIRLHQRKQKRRRKRLSSSRRRSSGEEGVGVVFFRIGRRLRRSGRRKSGRLAVRRLNRGRVHSRSLSLSIGRSVHSRTDLSALGLPKTGGDRWILGIERKRGGRRKRYRRKRRRLVVGRFNVH